MVEHDFYKLMQIPLYSNVTEVKRRYYELAVLYHPDKNPKNKDADEYFKILTQGYNILGDPAQKIEYDELLRQFYARKKQDRRGRGSSREISQRLFQKRERIRKDTIEDYLEAESILSHKKRFLMYVLISLSGFLLTFNHWFVNYLKYDFIYNFIGFIVCYAGCYFIANNIYHRDAYKNAIHLKYGVADKRAIRTFLALFFLVPVVFMILIHTSARIQLKYYSKYTDVEVTPQYDGVFYEYTVRNKRIKRLSDIEIDENTLRYKRNLIKVRYSTLNPNISEIVLPYEPVR